MHSKAVLIAALSVGASATFPEQNAKRAILARQTDIAAGCTSFLDLASSFPTPPPDVQSYQATADPCATVPASLSDAYSSYGAAQLSWIGEHSAEINSAISACPEIASLAPGGVPDVCSTGGSVPTDSSSGAGPSKTADSSSEAGDKKTTSSGSKPTTTGSSGGASTVSGNFGARETGFAAAAVAAAGFLGAVAML